MNILETNYKVFIWQIIFSRYIESIISEMLNNALSLVLLTSASRLKQISFNISNNIRSSLNKKNSQKVL